MFIEIDKIDSKGLALDDKASLDKNLLIEQEGTFLEDIAYHILLTRDNEKIRARGNIHTALSIPCVRCLQPFDLKIDSQFDIILLPARLMELSNQALDPDDMEYIFFEGDRIDLAKILMEQVNLFIPFKPVCNPSCKGLCPHCGVNLNNEHCRCKRSSNEINILFDKITR